MAHTDSVPTCLYTQLGSTQVNTQLPQGTKSSNQIPCKVHQQSYIWILIYQRISSQGSLLGWQRKSTQWYTKIPFFSLSTNAPFHLVLQDLIFPVTDSTWARRAINQKQTYAERLKVTAVTAPVLSVNSIKHTLVKRYPEIFIAPHLTKLLWEVPLTFRY